MKKEYRKQYFAGMLIVGAAVVFFLSVFVMLSRTNKIGEYLMDTASQRFGWSYETLSGAVVTSVVPEFQNEYTISFPGKPAEAVRMKRVFKEDLPYARLKLYIYGAGVEVFLEDTLLYSDFQGGERNEEGFLLPEKQNLSGINAEGKSVEVSLPEDYTGKELSIITYFADGMEGGSPVYPMLNNDETIYSSPAVDSVFPVVVLTICAICAVLAVVMFVLDTTNGQADKRILLLGLFFTFLFLDQAYGSLPGSYSILKEYFDLSFLKGLYIGPLYLFWALHLTKWRKYLLSFCSIAWFLYEGTQMYLNWHRGDMILANRTGVEAFLLFVSVAVALCVEYIYQRNKGKVHIPIFYILCTAIVFFWCILYGAREWNGDIGMYLFQVVISALRRRFFPLVYLIANTCAITIVIILVVKVIQRTVRTKTMVSVLEERSRLTLEGYNRMLGAEQATNTVRHEMRHHMTALMGLADAGETERICEYISSVMKVIDNLPVGRYSGNTLVNVIVGTYFDRAKKQGIDIQYSIQVPEKLGIADEDLSVFLTNMLENAVKACERMKKDDKRYIRVKMHTDGRFLFIGCTNSMADKQTETVSNEEKKDRQKKSRHGYGMAAMEKIAEEYGSILKVDKSLFEFSVKSNLCMKQLEN